jgi:hypothetical protein
MPGSSTEQDAAREALASSIAYVTADFACGAGAAHEREQYGARGKSDFDSNPGQRNYFLSLFF